MNNSPSLSHYSPVTSMASKSSHTHNKNNFDESFITINEKVNLTKPQHQVLKMICDTYQMSFSEYLQQALVEAMRFDIDEGNLCDALLEKIGGDDKKKDNNSPSSLASGLTNNDLDLLKKLQTQIP